MDSSIITSNYSNNPSTMYGTQIIELLSDMVTYDNNIGKFSLPYISPDTNNNSAYDYVLKKNNTGIIINKNNNLGLSRISTSNYLEITIPKHLFTIKEIQTKITPNASRSDGYYTSCNPVDVNTIIYNDFHKGQKFLMINLAGNVNKPYIIGVV